MCVIAIIDEHRPTEEMINKMWERNAHGAGIAWREPAKDGNGMEVVWAKGLDLEEVTALCATVPLPYVVHFRVASSGGIRPELTHPFVISERAESHLEGRTKNHVLFHNGDWKFWPGDCKETAIRSGVPIPTGRWSDTRAMAWLCSIYGYGFMDFIEQKGIAFGPGEFDLEVFNGNGWAEIDDHGSKIWCSNDYFTYGYKGHVGGCRQDNFVNPFCKWGTCRRKDIDTKGYCPDHPDGIAINLPKLLTPAPSPKAIEGEVVDAVAGGTQLTATPFRQFMGGGKVEVTEGAMLKLEVAEVLFKEKKISKNIVETIRHLHNQLKSNNQQKKFKAMEGLCRAATHPIFRRPVSGLVH